MDNVVLFFEVLSIWVFIAAGTVVLGVAVFFFVIMLTNRYRIKQAADTEKTECDVLDTLSETTIRRHSRYIIKLNKKSEADLIKFFRLPHVWIEHLKRRGRKRDAKRVLAYAPERGLFYVMLLSLRKKRVASLFLSWLKSHGDLLILRRVAISGKGEDFDGTQGLKLFSNRIDEIREMTGDPEWAARYFAVKILIHHEDGDTSARSQKSVEELVHDSNPLVRKTIITEFNPKNREKFAEYLLARLKDDPVYEVRCSAKRRLLEDFAEFYHVDPQNLSDSQALHLLETLEPGSQEDENTALTFISSKNQELRLHAAYFLDTIGVLSRMFSAVHRGDRDAMERTNALLESACSVGIDNFLEKIESTDNADVLTAGARLLNKYPDRRFISMLAQRVFKLMDVAEYPETYLLTVTIIRKYGGERSYRILKDELRKSRNNKEILSILLPNLPKTGDYIFADLLFDFLRDENFIDFSLLRQAIVKLPPHISLPQLIGIVKSPRDALSHRVRMEGLKILAALNIGYTIQFILENIHILSLEDSRIFSNILKEFKSTDYEEVVIKLLEDNDAAVRSSLISCLAVTENKNFLPYIRKGVWDADPDVRVSSVWSLVDYGDTRSLNQATDGLRDPVERVRINTAKALGSFGNEKVLEEMKQILSDKNEVPIVKKAVLEGLSLSENILSLNILVEFLAEDEELTGCTIEALAEKREKNEIISLIEHFKDAGPDLREKLVAVFSRMETAGSSAAEDLLMEDISSLKPYLSEILEKTGAVEHEVRKLSHRDPEVRRQSAEFLSKVGTLQAFRGVVLASRDPNQDVRVSVVKALERLNTASGKKILDELRADPDKRVRKYTEWAMERIKAKSL